VAQRRADLVRKRLVHSISCEMTEVSLHGAELLLLLLPEAALPMSCLADGADVVLLLLLLEGVNHHAVVQGSSQNDCTLKLRTQAGTYIKVSFRADARPVECRMTLHRLSSPARNCEHVLTLHMYTTLRL